MSGREVRPNAQAKLSTVGMWQSWQEATSVRVPPKRPPTSWGAMANTDCSHSLNVRSTGNMSVLLKVACGAFMVFTSYVPPGWAS